MARPDAGKTEAARSSAPARHAVRRPRGWMGKPVRPPVSGFEEER
jgi:hypothetical protein